MEENIGACTDLNLSRSTTKHLVHKLDGEAIQALRKVLSPHASDFLEALVPGPFVHGHLEDELLHVNEAHALKHLFEGGAQDGRALEVLGGDSHLVEPSAHWPGWVQRAVITCEDGLDLLGLEPTAGLEGFKGLLGDFFLEVAPAARSEPGMYVAKLVRVVPRITPARRAGTS